MDLVFIVLLVIYFILVVSLSMVVRSKIKYYDKQVSNISSTMRAVAQKCPLNSSKVFNYLVDRFHFKEDHLPDEGKIKYIAFLFDKDSKNQKTFLFELSDKSEIEAIIKTMENTTKFAGNFDYYIREYKTVPDYIKLENECLRNIDPFDPRISESEKRLIMRECQLNTVYYFEMVMQIPLKYKDYIKSLNIIEEPNTNIKSNSTVFTNPNYNLDEDDFTDLDNQPYLDLKVAKFFSIEEVEKIIKNAKEAGVTSIKDINEAMKYLHIPDNEISVYIHNDIMKKMQPNRSQLSKIFNAGKLYHIYDINTEEIFNKLLNAVEFEEGIEDQICKEDIEKIRKQAIKEFSLIPLNSEDCEKLYSRYISEN